MVRPMDKHPIWRLDHGYDVVQSQIVFPRRFSCDSSAPRRASRQSRKGAQIILSFKKCTHFLFVRTNPACNSGGRINPYLTQQLPSHARTIDSCPPPNYDVLPGPPVSIFDSPSYARDAAPSRPPSTSSGRLVSVPVLAFVVRGIIDGGRSRDRDRRFERGVAVDVALDVDAVVDGPGLRGRRSESRGPRGHGIGRAVVRRGRVRLGQRRGARFEDEARHLQESRW